MIYPGGVDEEFNSFFPKRNRGFAVTCDCEGVWAAAIRRSISARSPASARWWRESCACASRRWLASACAGSATIRKPTKADKGRWFSGPGGPSQRPGGEAVLIQNSDTYLIRLVGPRRGGYNKEEGGGGGEGARFTFAEEGQV